MSVVEFIWAAALLFLSLFAGQEIARILTLERSAEIIVNSIAFEASLMSLAHIKLGTFEHDARKESRFELAVKDRLVGGLKDSLLHWTFQTEDLSPDRSSLSGLRTYAKGPSQQKPFHEIEVAANICVRTWVGRIAVKLAPQRNCLGQFSESHIDGSPSDQGLLVQVRAVRPVPYWVPIYFRGLRND